jgi:SAM-dependent methyltransferase
MAPTPLAIAQTLPEATVVGVDASASAIARGRGLASAAELGNVELRAGDFGAVESLAWLGPVDYVIAHGVYSWIPPAARAALLEVTRRALAPQGIAFVSYNAYPGSYLRDMTRDCSRCSTAPVTDRRWPPSSPSRPRRSSKHFSGSSAKGSSRAEPATPRLAARDSAATAGVAQPPSNSATALLGTTIAFGPRAADALRALRRQGHGPVRPSSSP